MIGSLPRRAITISFAVTSLPRRLRRASPLFALDLAVPLLLLAYVILDPELLDTFFRNEMGWTILVGCFVMEIIGAIWLFRLLRTDYF